MRLLFSSDRSPATISSRMRAASSSAPTVSMPSEIKRSTSRSSTMARLNCTGSVSSVASGSETISGLAIASTSAPAISEVSASSSRVCTRSSDSLASEVSLRMVLISRDSKKSATVSSPMARALSIRACLLTLPPLISLVSIINCTRGLATKANSILLAKRILSLPTLTSLPMGVLLSPNKSSSLIAPPLARIASPMSLSCCTV